MNEEIEEELAKLRQAKHTTPPSKVIELLNKYGFVEAFEGHGRRFFAHPLRSGPPVPVPDESPMLPAHVKRVANAIEEVMFDDS
jgi:hypothetical protein